MSSAPWPLKLPTDGIVPVSTEQFSRPAMRPKNSVLQTSKVRTLLGLDFPTWKDPIREFVANLRKS